MFMSKKTSVIDRFVLQNCVVESRKYNVFFLEGTEMSREETAYGVFYLFYITRIFKLNLLERNITKKYCWKRAFLHIVRDSFVVIFLIRIFNSRLLES